MLDEQAATNKAMIEAINQSNQANQTEMREQQKQDNAGLKDLMASMIGALKAELSTIITGNQQATGARNHPAQVNPQQQQPSIFSSTVHATLTPAARHSDAASPAKRTTTPLA
eukprot:scaffold38586_cov44-Attheya_sp.AAC.1